MTERALIEQFIDGLRIYSEDFDYISAPEMTESDVVDQEEQMQVQLRTAFGERFVIIVRRAF